MVNCELCGKEESLVGAFVEGVKFRVCSNCKKYGKVFEEKAVEKIEKKNIKREEFVDVVLDSCGNLIKSSREGKGLTQHDLAVKLNEKESTMSKIEQGGLKPNIELARKIEKFFGIKLITKEKISEAPTIKGVGGSLTIGDFIKK